MNELKLEIDNEIKQTHQRSEEDGKLRGTLIWKLTVQMFTGVTLSIFVAAVDHFFYDPS